MLISANKIKGFVIYEKIIEINGQRYELQGVVVHWGTMAYGHYIAVVKSSLRSSEVDPPAHCRSNRVTYPGVPEPRLLRIRHFSDHMK